MSKHQSGDIGGLTGTGVGSAVNVEALEDIVAVVGGTFVGTYSIEGSMDGTTFYALTDVFGNSLAGLTAGVAAQLPAGLKEVRLNCTAFTSGSIDGAVGGLDRDLR